MDLSKGSAHFQRALRLGLVLMSAAGLQAITQLLGMVAGLVIVRETTSRQYAFYSLAVAVIAVAGVVTESGLGNAMLSVSRMRELDAPYLGAVVVESYRWRRWLFLTSAFVGIALLALLLVTNGASFSECIQFCLATVINMLFASWAAAGLGVLRLRHQFSLYQRSSVVTSGLRAGATWTLFAVFNVGASAAIWISAGSYALQCLILRSQTSQASRVVDQAQLKPIRGAYRRIVLRILPMNLAIVLQGQVVFFVVGALGGTRVVAVFGALSRYAVVFAVVSVTSVLVLGPIVAHGSSDKARARVALACALVAGVVGSMVAVVYLLRGPLLELLGPQYGGYGGELVLVSIGGALQALVNTCAGLTEGMGWLSGSWLYLPATGAAVAALVPILKMTDPVQAGVFVAALPIPGLLIVLSRLVRGNARYGAGHLEATEI